MNIECNHMRVIVYNRCVAIQTREEPAEYEFKIECRDCGEYIDIDEIPEDAEETEKGWEDDYLEDDE